MLPHGGANHVDVNKYRPYFRLSLPLSGQLHTKLERFDHTDSYYFAWRTPAADRPLFGGVPGAQAQYSESGEGIGDALGFFNFPAIEGGAGNPGDVMDFLRFLTSEENQRAGAFFIVPVVKNTEDVFEDDPVMQSILEARNNAPYFQLYYDQFLPPAVGAAVVDAVQEIFAGTASPEEAAQMIEEAAAMELE